MVQVLNRSLYKNVLNIECDDCGEGSIGVHAPNPARLSSNSCSHTHALLLWSVSKCVLTRGHTAIVTIRTKQTLYYEGNWCNCELPNLSGSHSVGASIQPCRSMHSSF